VVRADNSDVALVGLRPITTATAAGLFAAQSVPIRALTLSFVAMAAAVAASVMWPEALIDQEILAGGLALIPALLLAHYRGWPVVTILLGVGLVALVIMHLAPLFLGVYLRGPFLILFVVAPYISIALGAGWFGEVRRYQTELRATQLQLIQSEKLDSVGRMAAGVAHEVKNPLMMILTGIKVLAKRVPATDDQTRLLLQDMEEAVERADRIIGGLLNYSRDRDLDLGSADVNDTIERSAMLVKHDLENAHITLVANLQPGLPKLMLDEFKMQQVFVNLVTNAIHAIERDGAITITTTFEKLTRGVLVGYRKTDRYTPGQRVVIVRIEDSGPGIPEEYLEKIFDPFFTTKPTGRGTGLGLSVSQQIVEMHGGTIDVANRDGGGAAVTITLKVDREGASS
jgi:signal transduction histidine kinase